MDQVRWGIIGCGNVTEVKSGPAFNLVNNSTLVAVMRRNGRMAQDYAKRHNVPKWYSDAQRLINDPEVNAVYIATPPDSHAEYAIKSMEAGKPVYVEKPMARNHQECKVMLEVSKKTGIPLFVAYYRRTLPGFLKTKEWIDAGRIGYVRFVNLRLYNSYMPGDLNPDDLQWRVIPEIAGGGHFFDLASHQLDYLDFVFGPISRVISMVVNQGKKYPAEDIVLASFEFESGVMATGTWCFTVSGVAEEDTIEIIGSDGKITFSTFGVIPVRLTTSDGEEIFEYENPNNIQYYLIESIVNELLGRGTCPSTGISAARSSKIMDEVVKEYYFTKPK